ncbi:START-like domain-containing protein [Pontibacter silvestris]|uniref:START-like domain-containing protein n=1 Tax=Pontibacter silvestris TaxID=2305183 RepID=A0ABW4WZA8_9BACT|nr:START-like domain-containing protein [Pontibacter silvestris]MCC9135261.1 ATPase [Pontibacter silvestris]
MTKATKTKFVKEYPINASAKLVYPYLSSPSGLAQWFCDDVAVNEDKLYNFVWDGRSHYAEITGLRTNRSVRFIFREDDKSHSEDPSYIDFTIESSELTQEQFVKVVDYSDEEDHEELDELWEHLMQKLRETVGG